MKYSIASVAALALAMGACSSDESNATDSTKLGSAEALLTLPGGFTIDTINFNVTGNGQNRPGSVDVRNSSSVRFRVGNLPLGTGYTLALTATANGNIPCTGSAPFSISDRGVTGLTIPLRCGTGPVTETDNFGDLNVRVDVEIAPGVFCPVVTGITALPLETAVGSNIALEGYASSAPGSVSWTGVGGTFSSSSSAATSYTCQTGGLHSLTFSVAKPGCESVPADLTSLSVEVECTGATAPDAGPDASEPTPDAGPDASEPTPDAGPDAGEDAGPDASEPTPDAGPDASEPTPDAGPDSGPDAGDPCLDCVKTACTTYVDVDWVAPCFNGSTTNPFQEEPEVQPLFSQLCTNAVSCSLNAPSNCADDAVGPARCYCGSTLANGSAQTITNCLQNGPAPDAECVQEWNAATECPAGDYACTAGANFSDFSRPSGFAFSVLECANASCSAQCGLTQ